MALNPWRAPRVPVLVLRGLIAARPYGINIRRYREPIRRAFALARQRKLLMLAIESPGGSPVESDLVARYIRAQADIHGVRLIAVIGDVGASGGYWLACCADEILANRMSIVGSIGVIGGGFGLADFIHRHGIERRVYTAGAHKARLDPFRAEDPDDVLFTQGLLTDIHDQFKDWVRVRRGPRLVDEKAAFDGSYMLGSRALELGLIDGVGSIDDWIREWAGPRARPHFVEPRRPRGIGRLFARSATEAILEVAAEHWSHPLVRTRL